METPFLWRYLEKKTAAKIMNRFRVLDLGFRDELLSLVLPNYELIRIISLHQSCSVRACDQRATTPEQKIHNATTVQV